MPIKIPDALPATDVLEGENIFVMTEFRAMHQDIRPLKVLLLNLMPTKIVTETQIMRKLSNTPLQIEVSLLQTASHESKNVSEQHLETFYTTFDEIKGQHFDIYQGIGPDAGHRAGWYNHYGRVWVLKAAPGAGNVFSG